MACVSPITKREKNSITHFPCGKCNFCLSSLRADWSFRLQQEYKASPTAWFLTLTYDDKHQPMVSMELDSDMPKSKQIHVGTLNKKHLQDFFKLLRYYNEQDTNTFGLKEWPTIKYYAVGEYGENTQRPHYHAIVFNIKPYTLAKIPAIWKQGHCALGNCEPASIHYVTKYVIQKTERAKFETYGLAAPFTLISKRVGANYLHTNGFQHKEALQNFVYGAGGKQRLPRYYKDKIFSIAEKKSISDLAKLDNDLLHRKIIEQLEQSVDYRSDENPYARLLKNTNDRLNNVKQKGKPNQL